MDDLDSNVFTGYISPFLTGEIVDRILLLNKHYNKVIKSDMKHLYKLYWEVKNVNYTTGQLHYKHLYKDGLKEGEQLGWYENGQPFYNHFYKEDKKEGEQIKWHSTGKQMYKEFYKDGKKEGEQSGWHVNGAARLPPARVASKQSMMYLSRKHSLPCSLSGLGKTGSLEEFRGTHIGSLRRKGTL